MKQYFYSIFILSAFFLFASCDKEGVARADVEELMVEVKDEGKTSDEKEEAPKIAEDLSGVEEILPENKWLIGRWAAYNEKDYKKSALLTHFTFSVDKKFTCIFTGDIQMGGHGGFSGPFEVIDNMIFCYYKYAEHGKDAFISLRIDKKTDATAQFFMTIVKQKGGEDSHNFELYCKKAN